MYQKSYLLNETSLFQDCFGVSLRREEAIEVLREISKRCKDQAFIDSISIIPHKEPYMPFSECSEAKFRIYLQTSLTTLSDCQIQTYLDKKDLKMMGSEKFVIVYRPSPTAKEQEIVPGLQILRRKRFEKNRLTTEFHFAVINLKGNSGYPSNFLCQLPKLSKYVAECSEFSRLFGEQSKSVAKTLLSEALENEVDPLVRSQIRRRLAHLTKVGLN